MSDADRNAAGGTPLAQAARQAFARHETFPPRYGWLRNGYCAVTADSGIFGKPEAPLALGGVTQSQVKAIRYWMSAFKLTEERGERGRRRPRTVPTWEAQWLLSDDGADPYLEDPASLWFLHWRLLSPPCTAPTWWMAFNTWYSSRFRAEDLARHVTDQAQAAGWDPPKPGNVQRDIGCLTRMYAGHTGAPGSGEDVTDLLNRPFRELNLLQEETTPGGRDRQWRLADLRTVPGAVVAYACLDHASHLHPGGPGSVSVSRLASEPGSPGRALRLREEALTGALEETAARHPAVSVTHSGAGQAIMVFASDPGELAWDILDAHYLDGQHGSPRARVATREEWAKRYPRPDPRPWPVPPTTRRRASHIASQPALFEMGASRSRPLRAGDGQSRRTRPGPAPLRRGHPRHEIVLRVGPARHRSANAGRALNPVRH